MPVIILIILVSYSICVLSKCSLRDPAQIPATNLPTQAPAATSTQYQTATATHTPETIPTGIAQVRARVIDVVDGDTIKVVIGGQEYTVRYIGIDTPETVHPNKSVEWMGPEASAMNKSLVQYKFVLLERDVSETDRYGRLLRYVYLEDGMFVNAELVRLGYAQVSTYPPDVKYKDLFLAMQQEAQNDGVGLWSPTAMPTATLVAVPQPTVGHCCKICRTGKACGDACISKDKECTEPPGCACDG